MRYKLLLLLLWLTPRIMAQAPLTSKEATATIQRLATEPDKVKKADLLYQVAVYYLEKSGSLKSNIDSASLFNRQLIAINKQTGRKKNIANSMLLDGKIAIGKGNYDIGTRLKKKALEYAIANALAREQANAYLALADDMPYEDDEKAKTYYLKAAALYRKSDASLDEAEVYINLAINSIGYNQLESAENYIRQAIKTRKNAKRYDYYKEYALLCSIHVIKGRFRDALEYGLKAEKIAEDQGIDGDWKRAIYNYLGSIYLQLGPVDKAIEYNLKALDMAKNTGDKPSVETLTINVSNILYRQGKFAEALAFVDNEFHYRPGTECRFALSSVYLQSYCKLKQYDKARPYYENLLLCESPAITDSSDRELMYHAITLYLLETGQAAKAYVYINKLNQLAKHNGNLLERAKLEQATYRADSATGNYAGAFEHVKRYKALNDSIFNTANTAKLHDLQLRYETEKKDKNIKLLNSQNQLQRSRVENAEKAKNITLGGIIFAGIVIALLFVLYRIKQRNNRILEANQRELDQKNNFLEMLAANQDRLLKEKEWLVKEVHHRVKNNLQMVTSLLYSQSVYLEDDAAKRAVKDSLRRMQAMALIHQKLYQDENTSTVAMPGYIDELLQYLRESFDAGEQIAFRQHIAQVKLDVSQAVPLGLILTESVVNAIKYAFIHEQNGMVSISLQDDGTDYLFLEISDNGVGLPADPELMERNSLGLDLMEGLAGQLGGTFTIKSENGVHIAVRFQKKN